MVKFRLKNPESIIHKVRQSGATLLEALGGLAVGSVITAGVVQQTNTYIDTTKDAYTAEHARAFALAARGYVKENKASFTTRATSVTAANLQKYLPAGFGAISSNPYGQTPVLVVKKNPSGEVEGFLVYQGGDAIKPGRREFVGAMTGLGGGYVDKPNKPRGSGWDTSSPGTYFGGPAGVNAEIGRMVVTLNLFEPTDVLDNRYLCRTTAGTRASADCNNLGVDLEFASGTGIRGAGFLYGGNNSNFVLSATSVTVSGYSVFQDNVRLMGDTLNIDGTVRAASSVTVIGALSASTVQPMATKVDGSACLGNERGTIARKWGGSGVLLLCKKVGDAFMWSPLFTASEERTAIIGCWDGNDFCKEAPRVTCWERDGRPDKDPKNPQCDFDWKKMTAGRDREDGDGNPSYTWTAEIGPRTFCAIGFHAQTAPKYDPAASITSGTTTVYSYRKVSGDAHHTFCRVWPKTEGGLTKWFIKVGSAYQTPIACHAVCLSDGDTPD